jgi:hypothetical protein
VQARLFYNMKIFTSGRLNRLVPPAEAFPRDRR